VTSICVFGAGAIGRPDGPRKLEMAGKPSRSWRAARTMRRARQRPGAEARGQETVTRPKVATIRRMSARRLSRADAEGAFADPRTCPAEAV